MQPTKAMRRLHHVHHLSACSLLCPLNEGVRVSQGLGHRPSWWHVAHVACWLESTFLFHRRRRIPHKQSVDSRGVPGSAHICCLYVNLRVCLTNLYIYIYIYIYIHKYIYIYIYIYIYMAPGRHVYRVDLLKPEPASKNTPNACRR